MHPMCEVVMQHLLLVLGTYHRRYAIGTRHGNTVIRSVVSTPCLGLS